MSLDGKKKNRLIRCFWRIFEDYCLGIFRDIICCLIGIDFTDFHGLFYFRLNKTG